MRKPKCNCHIEGNTWPDAVCNTEWCNKHGLFPDYKPRGVGRCPKCQRFSRIVTKVADASPLAEAEGYYLIVDCKEHGRGIC